MANEITLKITRPDGSTSETTIPSGSYNVYSVEIYPGSMTKGAKSLEIQGDNENKAGMNTIVEFEEKCLPEYPVYIRWINPRGGYEYYMFTGRKIFDRDIERGDTYIIGGTNGIDARETWGEGELENKEIISCGAENLTRDEFDYLSGVSLSPLVEVYNKKREVFERLIVQDSENTWDSGSSRGSLSFEFLKIRQNIQTFHGL